MLLDSANLLGEEFWMMKSISILWSWLVCPSILDESTKSTLKFLSLKGWFFSHVCKATFPRLPTSAKGLNNSAGVREDYLRRMSLTVAEAKTAQVGLNLLASHLRTCRCSCEAGVGTVSIYSIIFVFTYDNNLKANICMYITFNNTCHPPA